MRKNLRSCLCLITGAILLSLIFSPDVFADDQNADTKITVPGFLDAFLPDEQDSSEILNTLQGILNAIISETKENSAASENPVKNGVLALLGNSENGGGGSVSEKVQGNWKSGASNYLTIEGNELILRDSFKRIILETAFRTREEGAGIILEPDDNSLTYPGYSEEPYGEIESICFEEGQIIIRYHHNYIPDEQKEKTFESVEEGPFDNIMIRDEEFLDELQGKWQDPENPFDILLIEGNHLTIGYDYGEEGFRSQFETDFHVISYTYLPESVYLIGDDLIETDFYAFTQFEYINGELQTTEMVMDADWDTSVHFRLTEEE